MGKAFVAKLAKQGARDPEALAAWIGRKKHGKTFAKLAAKGRKKKQGERETAPAAEKAAERLTGAHARLQESADRRQAARENRPEEVTRDVATAQRAVEAYRSNLGGGRISRVSDEKLTQLHALARRLRVSADSAMLDRQETKVLVELQSMVLREERRRSKR